MMSVGRGRDDGRGNARPSHRFMEVPDRLVLDGNGAMLTDEGVRRPCAERQVWSR